MEKTDIQKIIYEVLNQALAIDTASISPSDKLAKLADTDDWSFEFIPELEKRFGVSVDIDDWKTVGTIEEIREMIYWYLAHS